MRFVDRYAKGGDARADDRLHASYGAATSSCSELAIAHGIRRWGNEELRQMWRKDIDPQIEKLGLRVPGPEQGRLIR